VLARAGDVKDLANKILIALQDDELRHRLERNAYADVRKSHNWDTLVQKYIGIYRDLSAHT
jgi:glycosyltransferase involved in cell wall biosynthesis